MTPMTTDTAPESILNFLDTVRFNFSPISPLAIIAKKKNKIVAIKFSFIFFTFGYFNRKFVYFQMRLT
jgi:hypothetical protein